MSIFGGVEAGGTTFVCGAGTSPDDIVTEGFETTSPDTTIAKVVDFFSNQPVKPKAIGIGSFGPINYRHGDKNFGTITHSPKQEWDGVNIGHLIEHALDIPTVTETDVNCAAIGEHCHGHGQGCENLLYISVGTGIGGGILENGKPPKGDYQAEFGHIRIPRGSNGNFSGACRYHGDCLEGLASATAIKQRWGVDSPLDLQVDHPAWELEAHYLALAVSNAMFTFAPHRIILGGGIAHHAGLIESVRKKVAALINDYGSMPKPNELYDYIQPPGLKSLSGVIGAIELAKNRTAY